MPNAMYLFKEQLWHFSEGHRKYGVITFIFQFALLKNDKSNRKKYKPLFFIVFYDLATLIWQTVVPCLAFLPDYYS